MGSTSLRPTSPSLPGQHGRLGVHGRVRPADQGGLRIPCGQGCGPVLHDRQRAARDRRGLHHHLPPHVPQGFIDNAFTCAKAAPPRSSYNGDIKADNGVIHMLNEAIYPTALYSLVPSLESLEYRDATDVVVYT